MHGSWTALQPEAVDKEVGSATRALNKAGKALAASGHDACAGNCAAIQKEVVSFKAYIPLIYALRNPGMRARHWHALTEALGAEWAPEDSFTLAAADELGFLEERALKEIVKAADVAGKEFAIEQALDKMVQDWEHVELGVLAYRETGTFVIKV